jgi:glycerol-3-phosphate acyltransferase PlsY
VRLLALAAAYLCGAVPWGVLLARLAGVDPRRAGSGNIGASNVARTAGAALGIATLVLDVAKGTLPPWLAWRATDDVGFAAAAGVAAFVGHVFPVTLGFAGGKGVATALGVLLALCPPAAVVALLVFVLVFAVDRRASVASLAGTAVTAVTPALVGAPGVVAGAAVVMALVVAARHRDNLRRLRAGTEPRLRVHRKQASPGD